MPPRSLFYSSVYSLVPTQGVDRAKWVNTNSLTKTILATQNKLGIMNAALDIRDRWVWPASDNTEKFTMNVEADMEWSIGYIKSIREKMKTNKYDHLSEYSSMPLPYRHEVLYSAWLSTSCSPFFSFLMHLFPSSLNACPLFNADAIDIFLVQSAGDDVNGFANFPGTSARSDYPDAVVLSVHTLLGNKYGIYDATDKPYHGTTMAHEIVSDTALAFDPFPFPSPSYALYSY
jgi:hypothetical protein